MEKINTKNVRGGKKGHFQPLCRGTSSSYFHISLCNYMDMTELRGLPCVLLLEEQIGATYLFSQQINTIFFLAGGFAIVFGQSALHMDARTPVTQEYIYRNSKLINSPKPPSGF